MNSNPTPNGEPVQFEPIKNNEIHFVDINNSGLITGLAPHGKHVKFWNDFHEMYKEIVKNLEEKRKRSEEL